ncbi:hypothetical protein F4781DRAFT_384045 [Annulohypoxylon bovei var. microspora]|nr:hypothetical protein F4781DRAFT_384045 [Annulohypoxylon bovei var. microspora]
MSNLGPLTTAYSAGGTNCESIYLTNNDVLVYGTIDASLSSCMPTSFVPWDGNYYSPGICPSGYTYACTAGVGNGGTAATCCPTSYQCRIGRQSDDPAACNSLMLTDSSFTISKYVSADSGTVSTITTKFYASGNWVFAKGVVVRRASDDPVWDSITPTPSTLTKSSTTDAQSSIIPTQKGTDSNIDTAAGLSTGAKAGIGVGVSLGVLIITGMIWAAYFIGRRKRQAVQENNQYPSSQGGQVSWGIRQFQDWHVQPAELDEQKGHSELSAQHEAVELMGH